MFIMSGSQKLSKKSRPSLLEINRQANRKKNPHCLAQPTLPQTNLQHGLNFNII